MHSGNKYHTSSWLAIMDDVQFISSVDFSKFMNFKTKDGGTEINIIDAIFTIFIIIILLICPF